MTPDDVQVAPSAWFEGPPAAGVPAQRLLRLRPLDPTVLQVMTAPRMLQLVAALGLVPELPLLADGLNRGSRRGGRCLSPGASTERDRPSSTIPEQGLRQRERSPRTRPWMPMNRYFLLPALVGLVACAPNRGQEDPCAMSTPPTDDWRSYDEGAFTLQLPPEYERSDVQGIDSQVGRWEAPGKQVSYDFGAYSNPLEANELNAFPDLVVCQESGGRGSPRIVRYSPSEGGYAIGAHWPGVRQESGRTLSLTLEGVVERAEDQGELIGIIRSVRFATSAADGSGGAGDSLTGSEGGAASRGPIGGGGPPGTGYRAGGNEPFWTLTFAENSIEFSDVGVGDTVRAARPEPESLPGGWRFSATTNGQPFVVEVENRGCNDSMSGRPFPHSVTVTVLGRTYTGCGGDTAMLLTGDEWVVEVLEDAEASGSQRPTLQFSSSGELTGTGGCNRFRATYEITGEGLRIGPALATRRACVDEEANAQESRFFALLEQVTRFDITDDGALELLALDRPVIVARR